jgi:deoxyribose-phosphate aldolase
MTIMERVSREKACEQASIALASMIEHTLLGDNLDETSVKAHVDEAVALSVFGVCLPVAYVPLAKQQLKGTPLKLVTVIDFPLGRKSSREKAQEALSAQILGADEIDMVLDYQALIDKNYDKALDDLKAVVTQTAVPIKVIVETSALNREQLSIACALVALSHAHFIKTSTGFHKAGADAHDIALMRALLPERVGIKASGGIRDRASALAMVNAGACRIGSSKSKHILQVV